MQTVQITRRLPVLFALGAFLIGCDAPQPLVAPDVFEPQFGRGGGGGPPPPPVPITFSASGAFQVDPGTAGRITNESESILEFGGDGTGNVTRATDFAHTAATASGNGLAECAWKPASLEPADLMPLLSLLTETRTGTAFHGTIDKTSYGVPSSENQLGSMTTDADGPPLQHVDIGTFDLQPPVAVDPVTVVEGPGDTFAFSGGVLRIWDRNGKVKEHKTLVCPNYDAATVIINRNP